MHAMTVKVRKRAISCAYLSVFSFDLIYDYCSYANTVFYKNKKKSHKYFIYFAALPREGEP